MTFLRNGTNLDTLFEARLSTAASPVYFIDGSDLSQKYEKIASGSNIGYDVGFTYNGNDIRNIFAGKGTVTGFVYDSSLTYFYVHYLYSWDGKTWTYSIDNVQVLWGGTNKYNAASYSSYNYPQMTAISGDGYTYFTNSYGSPQVIVDPGNNTIRYELYTVARTIATPTITSFSISKTVSTSGDLITLVPVFSGGTATIGTTGAGSTQVTSSATSSSGYNVYPTSDTTYTLTVGGSVSNSKSVVVWPVPTVTSLTATSYYVTKDSYIELTPVFNSGGGSGYGTINGSYVYSGSNYGWYPGTVPTTTYTLLSVNAAGASASLSTNINVYNFPYNLSLTGSPSSIVTGDSSTLTASFDDSTCAAKIGTAGVGSSNITASIAKGGTVVVSPTSTTTYTLTVTNGAGSYTSTTKVITVTSGCGSYCHLDGACCPGPDVPITMSDNTKKPAKDVKVGDKVISWNEKLDLFEIEEVTDVEYADNHRFELFLDNGKSGLFAKNHRFLTGAGEWKELQNLKVDEELSNFVRVSKITDAGIGPVVKITVNQNHTYLTLGIVSHNLKGLN